MKKLLTFASKTDMNVMKQFLILLAMATSMIAAQAKHEILSPNIKTLQVVVNQEWMSMPVMKLGSNDVLNISFDELSHNYHRFVAHLEHCEPDWSTTETLFESDWLVGFNDQQIDERFYNHEFGSQYLLTAVVLVEHAQSVVAAHLQTTLRVGYLQAVMGVEYCRVERVHVVVYLLVVEAHQPVALKNLF